MKMQRWIARIFMMGCAAANLAAAAFAEELVISNPYIDEYVKTFPMQTKPRDSATIQAERQLMIDGAEAVAAYAKAHGVEQAAVEINKGKDGAFAQYLPGSQTRMSLFQTIERRPEGDQIVLKAHSLFANLIGQTLITNEFADVSGWKFLVEYCRIAFSQVGRGWVDQTLWVDEFWGGNKPTRFNAYAQMIDKTAGVFVVTHFALDE